MHQMEVLTQALQPGDQGILEVITAARLRQQSRRFQDHQQPWVLKQNRQRFRA